MLEQEWFFLASASPYQSSMYKTLNNSDEAMTTKTELFNPGKAHYHYYDFQRTNAFRVFATCLFC